MPSSAKQINAGGFMSRVLIVGGGVIGMLLAREMSKGGWQVSLFEKGICGREASWAGGGLVTPLYPWRYEPAITALASWSQDFYPQLAEELTRDRSEERRVGTGV